MWKMTSPAKRAMRSPSTLVWWVTRAETAFLPATSAAEMAAQARATRLRSSPRKFRAGTWAKRNWVAGCESRRSGAATLMATSDMARMAPTSRMAWRKTPKNTKTVSRFNLGGRMR